MGHRHHVHLNLRWLDFPGSDRRPLLTASGWLGDAIEAARHFWAVGDGVEYKKWLDFFSTRLNDQPLSDSVDRLVWSALAQSGGLDSYTGEYLVLEALDAGLDISAVSEAIKTVFPEYTYP